MTTLFNSVKEKQITMHCEKMPPNQMNKLLDVLLCVKKWKVMHTKPSPQKSLMEAELAMQLELRRYTVSQTKFLKSNIRNNDK